MPNNTNVSRISRPFCALLLGFSMLLGGATAAHASNVKTKIKRVHVYENGNIEVTADTNLCPDESGTEGWATVPASAAGYDGLLRVLISAQLSNSTVRLSTYKSGSDCRVRFAALWEG